MLRWIFALPLIAIMAAALGFGGLAGASGPWGTIVFFIAALGLAAFLLRRPQRP